MKFRFIITKATKLELIDDWKQFHKFWSVRLSLIGSALLTVITLYPDATLHMWNMLPPDLRAAIPEQYSPLIAVSIIVAGVIARLIKQKGLDNGHSGERKSED